MEMFGFPTPLLEQEAKHPMRLRHIVALIIAQISGQGRHAQTPLRLAKNKLIAKPPRLIDSGSSIEL